MLCRIITHCTSLINNISQQYNAPESVTQPINEIHPPELVHGEEVSRAEPHVALFEHVFHDFPLGGALVDVAVKTSRRMIFDYLADELAGLSGLAEDAEAVLIPQDVARLVDADEAHRETNGKSTEVKPTEPGTPSMLSTLELPSVAP